MDFTVAPSPANDLVVTQYDPAVFPKFKVIFEPPPEGDSLLRHLVQPPEDAATAVVLENRSTRVLTALRYVWLITVQDGRETTSTMSSDSYHVDVFRPVLKPQDRLLITRSNSVTESFLDHLLAGGGGIVGFGGRHVRPGETALRFEIDMALFEDGELLGPDKKKYTAELSCRKPAAEFIAAQIRTAEAEGRDVTPVLKALAEVPHLRDDFLAHSTQRYAEEYLHSMDNPQFRDARLRSMENRPELPQFYRRT